MLVAVFSSKNSISNISIPNSSIPSHRSLTNITVVRLPRLPILKTKGVISFQRVRYAFFASLNDQREKFFNYSQNLLIALLLVANQLLHDHRILKISVFLNSGKTHCHHPHDDHHHNHLGLPRRN